MKLKHITETSPGYRRKGRGKGYEYLNAKGEKLTEPEVLDRIKSLVIPPAWTDVWISEHPGGHIQATGMDALGRKQYIYHEEWSRRSNEKKFARMAEFAKTLPRIRKQLEKDLSKKSWKRDKVLALVVSILDETYFRIGNLTYAKENGSFGLTTLRRKHLKISGSGITFQFIGKSGKGVKTQIRDKKLIRLLKGISELPGYEVFQYIDKKGTRRKVCSQDVNAYIQEISGGEFTSKDFRTWGGTATAIEELPEALEEVENDTRKKLSTCLVNRVAQRLGNTAAVCREYYIHPEVLELAGEAKFNLKKLASKAKKTYRKYRKSLIEPEIIALHLIENG